MEELNNSKKKLKHCQMAAKTGEYTNNPYAFVCHEVEYGMLSQTAENLRKLSVTIPCKIIRGMEI